MRSKAKPVASPAFEAVKAIGLTLPGVTASVKYDGSPVLKVDGIFLAGLALDAEPDTLVIRTSLEDRRHLIDDDPETYYLTDRHRRYPVILVRLARAGPDALRELLAMSWRIAKSKFSKPNFRRIDWP